MIEVEARHSKTLNVSFYSLPAILRLFCGEYLLPLPKHETLFYFSDGFRFAGKPQRKTKLEIEAVIHRGLAFSIVSSKEVDCSNFNAKSWQQFMTNCCLSRDKLVSCNRYVIAESSSSRIAFQFQTPGTVQVVYECEVVDPKAFPKPSCSVLDLYLSVVLPFVGAVNDLMYEPISEMSNYDQLRRFCPKSQTWVKRSVNSVDSFPQDADCVAAPKIDGVSGLLQIDRMDGLLFKATVILETLSSFWFGLIDSRDSLDFANAVFQVEMVDDVLVIIDCLAVNNRKVRVSPEFYLDFHMNPILQTQMLYTDYALKIQTYHRNIDPANSEFPCDGIIAVVFGRNGSSYARLKQDDTVELLATSASGLEDSDSNRYLKLNSFDILVGSIYECSVDALSQQVVVLKLRSDRLFPNSRLRVCQAIQHEQVRLSDKPNGKRMPTAAPDHPV
ncbi:hypothetical protein HDE_06223 [Halotydeus destructor]|nr:hypothetical protein HDE_06223 [Halotydeus destructor]